MVQYPIFLLYFKKNKNVVFTIWAFLVPVYYYNMFLGLSYHHHLHTCLASVTPYYLIAISADRCLLCLCLFLRASHRCIEPAGN